MEFLNYLFNNIPLFSISFVVIFLAIRNLPIRKRESIYFIVFTALVIYLSIAIYLERYEASLGKAQLATLFTTSGYIVRPILLYIFCLLTNMEKKRSKYFYIFWALPLVINLFIYLLPLMFASSALSKVVFYYELQADGTALFTRGGALNFTAHVISAAYLSLLVYVSTLRLHGKHRRDAFVISLCIFFIVATVVVEVITGRNDLLNIICEICALANYIFINSINSSKDILTGLYDRRTFYEDVRRYKKQINGIIQIDMNGLKYLNDNYGHEEGDKALNSVAYIFRSSIHKETMFAYRLSGDEFVILMIQGEKEHFDSSIELIKKKIKESDYSIALGDYFIEKNSDISFEEAMRKSEHLMYLDKQKFYLSKLDPHR